MRNRWYLFLAGWYERRAHKVLARQGYYETQLAEHPHAKLQLRTHWKHQIRKITRKANKLQQRARQYRRRINGYE